MVTSETESSLGPVQITTGIYIRSEIYHSEGDTTIAVFWDVTPCCLAAGTNGRRSLLPLSSGHWFVASLRHKFNTGHEMCIGKGSESSRRGTERLTTV